MLFVYAIRAKLPQMIEMLKAPKIHLKLSICITNLNKTTSDISKETAENYCKFNIYQCNSELIFLIVLILFLITYCWEKVNASMVFQEKKKSAVKKVNLSF